MSIHQHRPEAEDQELLATVRSAPRGSRKRDLAVETLVFRYRYLVRLCAQRYRNCPEPLEDLMQVGYVGLVKAITHFDPARGTSLAGYAEPCIIGEIKRHFRDKRWQVHVRRAAQDLRRELRSARAELTQQLARSPRQTELASYMGVGLADLLDAERADNAFELSSLDAPLPAGDTLADSLGMEDPDLELVLDLEAVWQHWRELPERVQRLLLLRFYGELTQAEIGARLGMSQMHVSRLLSQGLRHLRGCLLGTGAASPHAVQPHPRPGRPVTGAAGPTASLDVARG
jgi:RNA polymerase sigma-B factor